MAIWETESVQMLRAMCMLPEVTGSPLQLSELSRSQIPERMQMSFLLSAMQPPEIFFGQKARAVQLIMILPMELQPMHPEMFLLPEHLVIRMQLSELLR